MRAFVIISIIVFTSVFNVWAQNKPVKIGDKLPDLQLNDWLGERKERKVGDFTGKGKILLIDFWATWCTSCTKSFPKLASIKEKLGNQVEIIAATYQSQKDIKTFFERYPNLYSDNMKFLVGDSLLYKLFSFRTIPHVVWVDGEGKVIATTNSDEVTEESVLNAINGSVDQLLIKEDNLDFDFAEHLETDNHQFLFRSVLTKYKPGVRSGGIKDPFEKVLDRNLETNKVQREMYTNTTISFLYMYAAYRGQFLKNNTHMIVLEIKDSVNVVHPLSYKLSNAVKDEDRRRLENTYCYELIVPKPVPTKEFGKYMMEDLNRYFDVYGTIEKRWVDCYSLIKKVNNNNKWRSEFSISKIVSSKKGNQLIIEQLNYVTLDQFVRYLNFENTGIPFVNDTGIVGPVDLKIGIPMGYHLNIEELRNRLNVYGLDFVKTKKMMDILVIRDK